MMFRSRARVWRTILSLAPMGFVATSGGCYSFGPMPRATTGAKSMSVELLLNERGRADLVDRLGPDVLTVQGELMSRQDSTVTIAVRSVRYINQSSTNWTGETLVVTNAQLRDIRQRRFSVGRTAVTVGAALGGFLAFVVTRSLSGAGDTPPPTGGGGGISQ